MANISVITSDGETIIIPSMAYAPTLYPIREDNGPFKTYRRKRRGQQNRRRRNFRKNKE